MIVYTVPPPASWPPGHFLSARLRPARSIRCTPPAQPGGLGTLCPPQSKSHHREYPASAGHWGTGGYWYNGLLTHTHTWGIQSSHPQTFRSHPKIETTNNKGERSGLASYHRACKERKITSWSLCPACFSQLSEELQISTLILSQNKELKKRDTPHIRTHTCTYIWKKRLHYMLLLLLQYWDTSSFFPNGWL